jgi:elongator complex protein 6
MTLTSQSSWSTQLAQVLVKALGELQVEKKSLFMDGLDFFLAAGEDNIAANEILTLLSTLSEVNHLHFKLLKKQRTKRTFISLFADHALLDSSDSNSLSKNQSILLTSLIHRAYSVISLRPLQTGTAKDVTGVIRLTRGGSWYDFEHGNRDSAEMKEWEMLYRIEDGRPKLFKYT